MSDSEEGLDIFQEPEGFYQAEKEPTFVAYTLPDGQELNLRLVGHNPLWGHLLWNAGRIFVSYLTQRADSLLRGKTVLELGAGAGLPSLVAAINGASAVLVTDYPDAELVENLQYNIDNCSALSQPRNIEAQGFLWGANVEPLFSVLPEAKTETAGAQGFDLLIMADLLFNHSEHGKLLRTMQETLKREPDARALVFFTPYRPWLLQNDLAFFEIAKAGGFEVEKIFEHVMNKVMFEEDPGDELLRRTVFGYELKWKDLK